MILVPVVAVFACRGVADAVNDSASSAQERDSVYWARRIQALREVALPDEWYRLPMPDTGKRIDAMTRLLDQRLSPSEKAALMKRLENDGQPFIHRTFYNRPMPPVPGQPARGEGLITAMSLKNRASVAILLSEMLGVLERGGRFSEARVREIEAVFR